MDVFAFCFYNPPDLRFSFWSLVISEPALDNPWPSFAFTVLCMCRVCDRLVVRKETWKAPRKLLSVSLRATYSETRKTQKVLHFQMSAASLLHSALFVQPIPPRPITEALLITLRLSELVSKRSHNAYTLH